MLRQQLLHALHEPFIKLLRLGGGRHLQRLLRPTYRIGHHKPRPCPAVVVHVRERATMRAGFRRAAALWRAAIVNDAWLLSHRLLLMPPAQRHVMDPIMELGAWSHPEGTR